MKKRFSLPQKSFTISFFLELLLFLFIFTTIILPTIFTSHTFILPTKSQSYTHAYLFFAKIFICAMFEELIYRVYLPFQMKRFFLKQNWIIKQRENKIFIIISNILFALAHSYLGILNVCFAFIMGLFFSFIYEYLKKNTYVAFFMISLIHFFHNAIMFYILMKT